MPDARAVIFDLDDTLYPLDRFIESGFDAVSGYLDRAWGVPRRAARGVLRQAYRNGERGRELQRCLARFALPLSLVPALVDVIRSHRPRLRLPRASADTLTGLRPHWRLGVVTNGVPEIQARKVAALGLSSLVDTIVYAHAVGGRAGKPDAEPFLEAAARLGVPAARSVFVGDDPLTDMLGASRVGMRTIQVVVYRGPLIQPSHGAEATVRSLTEVPDVAKRLVERHGRVHGLRSRGV